MNLIDTHFHLDLWNDPKEILKKIEAKQIYTIAVTNAPSVFKFTYQLTLESKYIRPALGYHPEVTLDRPNDLSLFKEYLNLTKYIGEIGLDYACKINKAIQKNIFTSIIKECFDIGGKIVTIHSRRGENDVIDIIGNKFPGIIILHWYSGSSVQMKRAISNGYYFSVNYPMTKSNTGKQIIKLIPIQRLLLESDGPFAKTGNQNSSPLLVESTLFELASIYNLSAENLKECIYNNFKECLKTAN
jgi:TatD DNase family protein